MTLTLDQEDQARKAAERDERRAQFKSALALRRMTAKEWAMMHGEVSEQQLYAVLKGVRESETLLAKIDAFIAEAHAERAKQLSAPQVGAKR